MAYLTLGGVTVPVARSGPGSSEEPVGKAGRAFDGTARSSIRAFKGSWDITTKPMLAADAATLEAQLLSLSPPIAATGTLTGSINVIVPTGIQRDHSVETTDGKRVVLTFTIWEA